MPKKEKPYAFHFQYKDKNGKWQWGTITMLGTSTHDAHKNAIAYLSHAPQWKDKEVQIEKL